MTNTNEEYYYFRYRYIEMVDGKEVGQGVTHVHNAHNDSRPNFVKNSLMESLSKRFPLPARIEIKFLPGSPERISREEYLATFK